MTKPKYIIALDQGTTSSRAVVFDHKAHCIHVSLQEFTQIYPKAGWVEHCPQELYQSQYNALLACLDKISSNGSDIAAIGITNQRETVIVWNKETKEPIYNAIVWQCRRSAAICQQLKNTYLNDYIKENTGLVLDPYFSASKIKWILDNVPNARKDAQAGKLLFGTVDTWLVYKLTQGKVHVTDFTNASRTMLFNINTLKWDETLLNAFDIPISMMPTVKSSSEIYGHAIIKEKNNQAIAIAGIAGDQQAALFGQRCVHQGQAKNTYGTGCFLLMNTGKNKITSQNGLITTLACGANGEIAYALEGSVFMGGASIQWLRDELHLLKNAQDSEYAATQVDSSNGVYVVPAFTGLGAPYWDAYARGIVVGLTRGVNRNHIIRATLESIAYQTKDVLDAMQSDSAIQLNQLRVDGGAVSNNFLMQFQSDLLNVSIIRPNMSEVTALGAAYLAGLAIGFWSDLDKINLDLKQERRFEPHQDDEKRRQRYLGWKKAIKCAQAWAKIEQE